MMLLLSLLFAFITQTQVEPINNKEVCDQIHKSSKSARLKAWVSEKFSCHQKSKMKRPTFYDSTHPEKKPIVRLPLLAPPAPVGTIYGEWPKTAVSKEAREKTVNLVNEHLDHSENVL